MLLRAIQVYARNAMLSLRQAASSIELLNTAKAALSIELRANYRITEKVSVLRD